MLRRKSGVFIRGALLVAIPIVLQFVFVGWLAVVLANAQEKLQAQWRSEELTRLACQFSRECTDVLVYMQMPVDVKKLMGDDVRDVGLFKPRRDFDLLYAMAKPNPRHQSALDRLERYGNTLFRLLSRELEAEEMRNRKLQSPEERARRRRLREARRAQRRALLVEQGKDIPPRLQVSAPGQDAEEQLDVGYNPDRGTPVGNATGVNYKVLLNEFGPKFYDAIEDLVAGEEESMADINSFGAAAIASINKTILFIVLLNLAVTGLLAYLYSVSIRNPIRHLGENGRRLSARAPLLPVLSGGDEFAKLDQLLHLNSAEVERALSRERAVMENAADLICIIGEDGNFLAVNPFVERMLGCLPEEILERPLNALVAPEQSLLADEYIRNAIAGKEQLFELKLQKRSGEVLDTRWSCIWSEEDKKLFCVVHDVSEEKAIEQLKQDFADMISHDLRSPLMAMGNSLALVEAGVKGEISESARISVQTSAQNVEKLIALVNDLLDFQKLKAGKMQLNLATHSLPAIVREAAALLAESAERKMVRLDLPGGDIEVNCDYNKVLQTVVNLLANAIKFSQAGSLVTVSISSSDTHVRISVCDTGPGVPDQFKSMIFEPFEQAPSQQKSEGTGLGLAICKLVVEAHGGSIHVADRADSESMSGSVFTVELPLH